MIQKWVGQEKFQRKMFPGTVASLKDLCMARTPLQAMDDQKDAKIQDSLGTVAVNISANK